MDWTKPISRVWNGLFKHETVAAPYRFLLTRDRVGGITERTSPIRPNANPGVTVEA